MTTKSRQNVNFLIAHFYHKCLSKSSVIINQLFASFDAVVVIYDEFLLGKNFVKRLNSDFKKRSSIQDKHLKRLTCWALLAGTNAQLQKRAGWAWKESVFS